MRTRKRNIKATISELKAEKQAEEAIEKFFNTAKIEFLNQLIDYYVNGSFIKVKSTSVWHEDKYAKKGRRRGRFVLNEEQHKFLVEKNGWYCFIIYCFEGKSYIRFIPARNLKFKRLINWADVFDLKGVIE